MVWDALNGVGYTPQVTKDYYSNPYDINALDFNKALVIYPGSDSDTGYSEGGSVINVTNDYFDYIGLDPYYIYYTEHSAKTAYIYFDIGKTINLREFSILFDMYGIARTQSDIIIQSSEDGATWTTLATLTGSVGIPFSRTNHSYTFTDRRMKVLRVKWTSATNLSSGAYCSLLIRRTQVKANSNQLTV